MRTRITEMLGIQHPIIQGGMHYVGFAELAAAVSSAGGLGIISGLINDIPTVKELIDRIMDQANSIIEERLGSMLVA